MKLENNSTTEGRLSWFVNREFGEREEFVEFAKSCCVVAVLLVVELWESSLSKDGFVQKP